MVTVPQQALPPGLITASPTGPAPAFFEGSVGVPDMPNWVKQVPNGAVLQGVVQGRTANNTYSVLTAQGPITITSALALQSGTQLLFQIGPEVANQRLQLVGGTNPLPNPPTLAPAGPIPGMPLPQAAVGQVLNAIVIRSADPSTAPGSLPPAPPPAPSMPMTAGVLPQAAIAAYAPAATTPVPGARPLPQGPAIVPSSPPLGHPAPQASGPQPAASPLPMAGGTPTLAGQPSVTPRMTAPPAVPPAPASPPSNAPSTSAPPPTASAPATPDASPARNAPVAPRPTAPTVFSALQPGEQVKLKIVAVTPPTPEVPDVTSQPPGATVTAARAPATVPAPAPQTPLGLLRDGLAALLARPGVEPIVPPGGNPPSPPTPAAATGPIALGTVIGNGAQNRPIIAIGTAVISLEAAPLPPGTQVQLVPQLSTPPALAQAAMAADAPLQGFPTYPSLPALVAAAAQAGGQTEQAILAMLPRVGSQLAASMMVFASGAAKGDLRTLVGDSARAALEKTGRGRAALAGAAQEFEAAGEEARGTSNAEWRAITLPVMTGGAAIEPIRLYLHQVSDEEAERNREDMGAGQRFLLDLDLTRIGPIQVDGLAKQTQLDVVIRTPTPLGQDVRDGIRMVFLSGIGARGVTGGITFQVAPKLVPDTGPRAAARGGLLV